MRCACRICLGLFEVVPTGAVTSSRLVISSETGCSRSFSKRQVAVREDADEPPARRSMIGTPEMR